MIDYDYDKYDDHEHEFDHMTLFCIHCGISKEAVYAGRDRPSTWDDVDEAYKDGQRVGIEIGQLLYKQNRRLKLIEVGYWLALRRISRMNEDAAIKRATDNNEGG